MKTYYVQVTTLVHHVDLLFVSGKRGLEAALRDFHHFWYDVGYESSYGEIVSVNIDVINETKIIHIGIRS